MIDDYKCLETTIRSFGQTPPAGLLERESKLLNACALAISADDDVAVTAVVGALTEIPSNLWGHISRKRIDLDSDSIRQLNELIVIRMVIDQLSHERPALAIRLFEQLVGRQTYHMERLTQTSTWAEDFAQELKFEQTRQPVEYINLCSYRRWQFIEFCRALAERARPLKDQLILLANLSIKMFKKESNIEEATEILLVTMNKARDAGYSNLLRSHFREAYRQFNRTRSAYDLYMGVSGLGQTGFDKDLTIVEVAFDLCCMGYGLEMSPKDSAKTLFEQIKTLVTSFAEHSPIGSGFPHRDPRRMVAYLRSRLLVEPSKLYAEFNAPLHESSVPWFVTADELDGLFGQIKEILAQHDDDKKAWSKMAAALLVAVGSSGSMPSSAIDDKIRKDVIRNLLPDADFGLVTAGLDCDADGMITEVVMKERKDLAGFLPARAKTKVFSRGMSL